MSVVHSGGGGMAYNQSGYQVMNGMAATGGAVRVDQMKPLVLGQINSFRLDASEAGQGTLDFSVGPPGKTIPHDIKNVGTQVFLVEFSPIEPVDHEVSIQFNEMHINGSPFLLKAPYMDISSVIVSGEGLVLAKVNQQSAFNINAARMPTTVQPVVTVLGPHGNVHANVITTDHGIYRVSWAPTHAGDHEVRVTMAGQEVPRSPFRVKVADPKQVVVDCPTHANLGNNAHVKVDASRAGNGKLVVIISVDGLNVPNTVHQDGPDQYRFSFKPNLAKRHEVTVQFNGENVSGSPFSCMVTGGSRNVVLTDTQQSHFYANPVEIEIDARSAGEGQIVAEVRSASGGVPSDLSATSTKKIYLLSFLPKEGGEHTINVTFNDEQVPQSPMRIHIQGGPVQDMHNGHSQHTETLMYQQQAPSMPQPPQQQVLKETVYHTQHQMAPAPPPPQQHLLREQQAMYTTQQDSPSTSTPNQSYDQYSSLQRETTRTITYQPQYESAMVGEHTYFEINPHGLSPKELDVRLQDPYGKDVPLKISRDSDKYRYEFSPRHTGKYLVNVDVEYTALPGSPFVYFVQPSSGVVVTDVTEEGEVGEEMYFIVDASNAGSGGDLDVEVRCNGQVVKIRREPLGQSQYRYTYIPKQGGEHLIDVQYNYESVPGCPVRTHVTEPYRAPERATSMYGVQGVSGRGISSVPVSQQAYFIIDMHGSNWKLSDVEVDVRGFPSVPLNNRSPARSPSTRSNNNQTSNNTLGVPSSRRGGSGRPGSGASGGGGSGAGGYETDDSVFARDGNRGFLQPVGAYIDHGGAPNGQSVPCKLFLESPNEIRVEYQTPYVGRHLVDIYCKGQRVAGSPYAVEVFDPKKVGLESMAKETYLHEQTEFEVIDDNRVVNDEAGSAEMECRVISPSGRVIPSHVVNTDRGMKVKYTPEEPGVYYVHTYIGGVEIPGSPMTQVVRSHTLGSRNSKGSRHEYRERVESNQYHGSEDGYGKITVSGDGLYRAEEDKPAHFFIDTHGMDGTPEVRVEGPHSVAKCSVTPEGPYRFKVTYIPVETGVYDIYVRWYNQEIDGSPFHPRVVDARKVRAKGDWQSKLDKEQRIQLEVGKNKTLMFDVSEAGPGELKAEVRHVGSGRLIPVTVSQKDSSHYYIDFVPDQAGDYLINIYWTDTPIPNSPIRGFAEDRSVQLKAEASGGKEGKSGKEFSSTTTKKVIKSGSGGTSSADHSKVVLSGTGLKEGVAGELAVFYIDGTKAADGEPTVILKNSRLQHIPIELVQVDHKSYKCTYMVREPGTYTLFVTWGDRDLLNSPYPVVIRASGDVVDAAGGMNSHQNYNLSSYREQHSASGAQQQMKGGNVVPMHHQDVGQGQQQSSNQQQHSQTGMSKHFVRKAKMTTSSNQSQSQNIGENFQLMIDAQAMSGGELVARCTGPTSNAKCELVQKEGGLYALNVRPQEGGDHALTVTYKGEHIDGSPFQFNVNGPLPPDPTKVYVHGPGVEHGILPTFQSKFYVETEGAGAGNLSVKMRGPRGGFQATMKRVSQKSRTIECTYNPTEVGLYIIHVKWSGTDVPGSPFHVHIFDTHYELDKFVQTGELPNFTRDHHILQLKDPTQQSYQTSAYQTNTLHHTLKKSKKSKSKKNGHKNGETVLVQPVHVQQVQPIQQVQQVQQVPVQYVVKESQYRAPPQPQFVQTRADANYVTQTRGDANYVAAPPGRPVVNGAAMSGGGGYHQSYHRETHYNSGGGSNYGTSNRVGSRSKFIAPENGPTYSVVRK